jgi:hypothetical protein
MSAKQLFPRPHPVDGRSHFHTKRFNNRNFLLWQEENAVRQSAFQYRWSINVWAGIIVDRIVSIINLFIVNKS